MDYHTENVFYFVERLPFIQRAIHVIMQCPDLDLCAFGEEFKYRRPCSLGIRIGKAILLIPGPRESEHICSRRRTYLY